MSTLGAALDLGGPHIVAAVPDAAGPPVLGVVLGAGVGVALIAVAVVGWRRKRHRSPDVPRSEHLARAGSAWIVAGFGVLLLTLTLWPLLSDGPMPRAAAAVLVAGLCVGVLALGVGQLVRVGEGRAERRLRGQLGLSTLRRRMHWAVPVVVWAVAFPFLAVGLLYIAVYAMVALGGHPDFLTGSGPTTTWPALFGTAYFGGGLALGLTQAHRRRVRDRQIHNADLAAGGVEFVVDERPPTWMPAPVARTWRSWRQELDAQVAPGSENGVIAGAVAGVLLVALTVVVLNLGPAPTDVALPGGRAIWLLVTLVAGVGAWVVVIGPTTTTGLRTALRQRRPRRRD